MRYIGCKTLLLNNIEELIQRHKIHANSFCDIFSGTSTVARFFKSKYSIISNDVLYFSYCLQKGTIENQKKSDFKKLCSVFNFSSPIDYLNNLTLDELNKLPIEKRFFQNNYSPSGGRMYLTDENALRIDFARNSIEDWKKQNLIDEDEYYYLLAGLIEGIPFVSNIAGTYGAFSKKWDKRSYKTFQIIELPVFNNKRKNKCYNEDGNDLIRHISGDILYIDPPYNERQYLPNYHILETAAKYDFPTLKGITGQRGYGEKQKSLFCSKRTVLKAFEDLISNANFSHIILSYSTDGIMSIDEIENIMKKYGNPESFEINKINYRRYKSRESKVEAGSLSELLIYIEKGGKND